MREKGKTGVRVDNRAMCRVSIWCWDGISRVPGWGDGAGGRRSWNGGR